MQKENNDCFFCWKSNYWKKDCNELQTLINNEHVYVNDKSFFKNCENKSNNAEFSLRFSKNVNQLNKILSAFELNANVYFSIRANALSITIEIFENATNYIYDSKEKKYRSFRIKILNQEKKEKLCENRWKKNFSKVEKKSEKRRKFFDN